VGAYYSLWLDLYFFNEKVSAIFNCALTKSIANLFFRESFVSISRNEIFMF